MRTTVIVVTNGPLCGLFLEAHAHLGRKSFRYIQGTTPAMRRIPGPRPRAGLEQ
jgi:hypothetical protein